jgi:hypothetical protein
MQIKLSDHPWQEIMLVDATARTLTLSDGSVWHVAQHREELIELDLFITTRIEKYAPWESTGKQSLILTGDREILDYLIKIETGDELKHEFFYFNRFAEDESEYFRFPDYLMRGVCVPVDSATVRYFLADTLFFDYLLSQHSSPGNQEEMISKLSKMKKKWLQLKSCSRC